MATITVNGKSCQAEEGSTILAVAAAGGIYIPTLCHHPDLPPFVDLPLAQKIYRGDRTYENGPLAGGGPAMDDDCDSAKCNSQSVASTLGDLEGCGLCVVEVQGTSEPVRACHTLVSAGMSIQTDSDSLAELRRARLMKILARHPHACLTCAQREGCSLEDCSSNVPKEERCCSKFHNCEFRKVAEFVGVKEETPRYRPSDLPVLDDEPLFVRNFDLCIDCARCVRVCNQVRGVEALGIVHHSGRLVVGSVAPTLADSACKFCGACVEVCPTGCLMDKESRAGDREEWLVPCVHTCPAGVDVPGYARRIARGDFKGAAALVWEKLPLANTLGHICFHLCECECRRSEIDDPIAICALKRFALEAADGDIFKDVVRSPSTGRKVAIVGGGPAGLTAAYFLTCKGHAVTVFEAAKSAGGMPALSVPQYRLPQVVLERDLAAIRGLGVEIKTGCRMGEAGAMSDLLCQGYDALLVAVGLPESKKISIEGGDLPGVYWGLDFLGEVKSGKTFDLGKKIVVIGGGNVAVDVAMTALRQSGAAVHAFCLEGREEMPAHAHEIATAEAEGVVFHPGWGPAAILGVQGSVSGVELRRCTSVFDKQRRFAPTFDDGRRMTVEADAVILAIGQAPPDGIPEEGRGIFRAGDIAGIGSSGGSVVDAVASGRGAAERIDSFLGGDGRVSVKLVEDHPPDAWLGREEGFAPRPRVPVPCVSPEMRRSDFAEIEGTYSREDAIAEAKRCLQCDLRLVIAEPELPPEEWLELSRGNIEQAPAAEGVFILVDSDRKPTVIKGTADIRAGLMEKLESGGQPCLFRWEEDRMFTKRESELIQQHLSRYGELPGGGDDELDDLF